MTGGSAPFRLRARYRRGYPRHARPGEVEEEVAVAAGEPALLLIDVYPREGLEAEIVRIAIAPARAAARRAGVRGRVGLAVAGKVGQLLTRSRLTKRA